MNGIELGNMSRFADLMQMVNLIKDLYHMTKSTGLLWHEHVQRNASQLHHKQLLV